VTERGYASVVLDVDSTLSGVEGIDWLAVRREGGLGEKVASLTERAMSGEISLSDVYGERLKLVNPSRADVAALADMYQNKLAPGAVHAVRRLHEAARRVVLVSGGIREAILPLATSLGIGEAEVHAVSVSFTPEGRYAGYDASSPLTTSDGKREVVRQLALPRRVLGVGDGSTDLAMKPALDLFAAYTGFVTRAAVVAGADIAVKSFDQIVELALA
jgi:phosphoserine phosphatase